MLEPRRPELLPVETPDVDELLRTLPPSVVVAARRLRETIDAHMDDDIRSARRRALAWRLLAYVADATFPGDGAAVVTMLRERLD